MTPVAATTSFQPDRPPRDLRLSAPLSEFIGGSPENVPRALRCVPTCRIRHGLHLHGACRGTDRDSAERCLYSVVRSPARQCRLPFRSALRSAAAIPNRASDVASSIAAVTGDELGELRRSAPKNAMSPAPLRTSIVGDSSAPPPARPRPVHNRHAIWAHHPPKGIDIKRMSTFHFVSMPLAWPRASETTIPPAIRRLIALPAAASTPTAISTRRYAQCAVRRIPSSTVSFMLRWPSSVGAQLRDGLARRVHTHAA